MVVPMLIVVIAVTVVITVMLLLTVVVVLLLLLLMMMVVIVVVLMVVVMMGVVMMMVGRVHGTLFGRHARNHRGRGDHFARARVLLAHAGRVARMRCCGDGSWVVGVPRRWGRVHHAHHFGHAVSGGKKGKKS